LIIDTHCQLDFVARIKQFTLKKKNNGLLLLNQLLIVILLDRIVVEDLELHVEFERFSGINSSKRNR
jgi:hypothetical protein